MAPHHYPHKIRVHRKGYHRKSFTEHRDGKRIRVAASYVPPTNFYEKDRGERGHGPRRIGKLKRGGLHGWHASEDAEVRREHIRKAIEHSSYSTVEKRLNALTVLDKHTDPEVARTAESDKLWLHNERERARMRVDEHRAETGDYHILNS